MMAICLLRGRRDMEEHVPHHNWFIVIFLLLTVGYIGHIMFTPSTYQFVTTPRSRPTSGDINDDQENSDRYWPGLGGTDRDYAWTLICFSLFEALSIPPAAVMMKTAPFTVSILVTMSIYVLSGVVYATATDVWMVILARCFMGCGSLFMSSIVYTYIGEAGTIMDRGRLKKGKPRRKNLLYTLALLATFFANAILLGFYAAIARIPSVNPYRWPGWFLVASAVTLALITLLFFTEPRQWTCRRKNKSRCSLSGLCLSLKLKSNNKRQFMIYAFMLVCAYVNGQALSVVFTLVTPVLSDQFGFSVANTSLFLLAVPGAYFGVLIIVLIAEQLLKGNNRIVVGLSMVISLCGCALISDWQAISYRDSCYFPSNETGMSALPNLTEYVEKCETRSTSGQHCFWNPQSRVNGDHCNTCHQTCLSQEASLNFYQFNVGVFLTAMGSILGFIFNNALNSDITSANNQGVSTAVVVGCNALSRAVTPFWFVESYEQTGRHTYFPMAVTIGSILITLVALVVLYNKLGPRPLSVEIQAANCVPSNVDTELEATDDPEPDNEPVLIIITPL